MVFSSLVLVLRPIYLFNTLDIDILAGVTQDEGCGTFASLVAPPYNVTLPIFKELVAYGNSIWHFNNIDQTVRFYLDGIDTTNSSALIGALSRYFGDIAFVCPTYLFAKQFALKAPKRKTYFYEVTYDCKNCGNNVCPEDRNAVSHGAEQKYVFGQPFLNQSAFTQLDRDFSREVMNMWTNFAKRGYVLYEMIKLFF